MHIYYIVLIRLRALRVVKQEMTVKEMVVLESSGSKLTAFCSNSSCHKSLCETTYLPRIYLHRYYAYYVKYNNCVDMYVVWYSSLKTKSGIAFVLIFRIKK